jgi:hypothetical protein
MMILNVGKEKESMESTISPRREAHNMTIIPTGSYWIAHSYVIVVVPFCDYTEPNGRSDQIKTGKRFERKLLWLAGESILRFVWRDLVNPRKTTLGKPCANLESKRLLLD